MKEIKTVYQIREDNNESLKEKINKLKKTANKLNCLPITCNILEEEIREIKEEGKPAKYHKYYHVEIKGESPVISGYKFLGTIQHEEAGNILRIVPGNDNIDLTHYRTVKAICNHCRTNRRRKDTYLIQHETTKEIKQIGKSCLKDFLGHSNPQQIASYLEYLLNMEEYIKEELFLRDGSNKTYIETITYLNFTAECILRFGFISKTKQRELYDQGYDNIPLNTASRVFNIMFPMPRVEPEFKEEDISEKALTLAKNSLTWAINELEPGNNDYLHNLKIAVASEYMNTRNAGIIAALIPTYQREVEKIKVKKQEKKEKQQSNYVGNIKDKIQKELTLIKEFIFETEYGIMHIYKFKDAENNIYIWKTSKNIGKEEGEKTKIKGTIKDHSEYRGEKQTVLTRCKIII